MRLWSLHPQYLDAKGLVALWREALLAQKVLLGATRGYHHHPQLARFQCQRQPMAVIAAYLREVWREAVRRGYHFDQSKIAVRATRRKIAVNDGQLEYELAHLKAKLKLRNAAAYARIRLVTQAQAHPLFEPTPGAREDWEVVAVSLKRRAG